MKLDFSHIPQTSRTLIIERFNEEMPDLCTLIKGRTGGEMLEQVTKKLCVKSFEEFKEKFVPKVYEMFFTTGDGDFQVSYSLEKKENAREITLCEHEFYRAVHEIAQEKANSSENLDGIDYRRLYEALDPAKIYKRERARRKDVSQYVLNAYEENDKGNPDGARRWLTKAQKECKSICSSYTGSALRLLPLVIKDIEIVLEQRSAVKKDSTKMLGSSADTAAIAALPCEPTWDEGGNLVLIKRENAEQLPVLAAGKSKTDKKASDKTAALWEKTVANLPDGDQTKNMILSIYSEKENTALANKPADELEETKARLAEKYVQSQQTFCSAVGSLVQKVASLEQFFLHAADISGEVEGGVVIANCSASDIINNGENVKVFLKNARNNENDHIWLAVLPAVMDPDSEFKDDAPGGDLDIDSFDFFDEDETDRSTVSGSEEAQISDIIKLTNILAEYGILSFINFSPCEETSFRYFGADTKIIDRFDTMLKDIRRRDAVALAYPNFTIIPKNKSQLKEIVTGSNNQTYNLYVPSIYINAAYVAAGIVAATQSEKIQKKKFGKKIKDGNPFMRFDLEEAKNCEEFIAKFNPESRINMDREVTQQLQGKKGNAFCFRSDTRQKNAFVLTARTLNAKPIYYFLTQNYFSFLLERTYSRGRLTAKEIQSFISDVRNTVQKEADNDIVNHILQAGDSFVWIEETQRPTLKFKGIEEPADINVDVQEDEI